MYALILQPGDTREACPTRNEHLEADRGGATEPGHSRGHRVQRQPHPRRELSSHEMLWSSPNSLAKRALDLPRDPAVTAVRKQRGQEGAVPPGPGSGPETSQGTGSGRGAVFAGSCHWMAGCIWKEFQNYHHAPILDIPSCFSPHVWESCCLSVFHSPCRAPRLPPQKPVLQPSPAHPCRPLTTWLWGTPRCS